MGKKVKKSVARGDVSKVKSVCRHVKPKATHPWRRKIYSGNNLPKE